MTCTLTRIFLPLLLSSTLACGPGGSDSTSDPSDTTATPGTDTSAGPGSSGGATTGAPTTGATTTNAATTDAPTTDAPTTDTPSTTSVGTTPPPDTETGVGGCDPGYADGCCFGDGECCPCVGSACEPFGDAAAIEAFQQCACAPEVCADACTSACAGEGIDVSCFVCTEKVARTDCKTEFEACGGALQYACDAPPVTCDECRQCTLTGACYDAWLACWQDPGCFDIKQQCEPDCQDTACLQACADAAEPAAAALYQAWLGCTFCDNCSETCGTVGVTCP